MKKSSNKIDSYLPRKNQWVMLIDVISLHFLQFSYLILQLNHITQSLHCYKKYSSMVSSYHVLHAFFSVHNFHLLIFAKLPKKRCTLAPSNSCTEQQLLDEYCELCKKWLCKCRGNNRRQIYLKNTT